MVNRHEFAIKITQMASQHEIRDCKWRCHTLGAKDKKDIQDYAETVHEKAQQLLSCIDGIKELKFGE